MIYLDYAASAPPYPEVLGVFNHTAAGLYANPSSEHKPGLLAENKITEAREGISTYLGCDPEEIYFTSGATMSNNLVIRGFMHREGMNALLCSAVEHNDIMMLAEHIYGPAKDNHLISVDRYGTIKLDELEEKLAKLSDEGMSVLVSVQTANSETGVIQPIEAISKIVHKYPGCYLHTDATQYLPYFTVNMRAMGIDAMSMSGQKIGGLKGSGLLYLKKDLVVEPLIFGEQGLIGGTPATPLITSLARAFEINSRHTGSKTYSGENDHDSSLIPCDCSTIELCRKRNHLLVKLMALGAKLVGNPNPHKRLPGILCIRFPGIPGKIIMHLLADKDICISTGSACSSGSDKPSHVGLAYGLTDSEAAEMIRFSVSYETSYHELGIVEEEIKRILKLL